MHNNLPIKVSHIIITCVILWEFFTPAFAGAFLREFVWQQVSSNSQDSSQYSRQFNNAVIWMVSTRNLCISFSRTDFRLCLYYLIVWSNFLHNFRRLLNPPSHVYSYYFRANLLHSLIMWLIDLSLSPHYLQLLFCCI